MRVRVPPSLAKASVFAWAAASKALTYIFKLILSSIGMLIGVFLAYLIGRWSHSHRMEKACRTPPSAACAAAPRPTTPMPKDCVMDTRDARRPDCT
ncbi:hypothetical protein GCM10007235_17300 [Pseudoxanthomonas indica]|nr:hypothetical protein GCM10007235_17300 [Pseudoxanthomonas indica]